MKNIAVYELVDGVVLNLYKNRAGLYVVQSRDSFNGREFDTQDQAIEHVLARAAEAELYNKNES